MSRALLLVGHGTLDAGGVREFEEFAHRMRGKVHGRLVEHCFIELAEPDVHTGIDTCVRKGATTVVVVPVILLAANHSRDEVPEYIDMARERHPEVAFHSARPLGIDPLMIRMLRDRFAQVEAAHGPFCREETGVALVGRGCSDYDANSDVAKIARILLEAEGVGLIDICYTGVTHPDLPTVIRRLYRLGARRVVVLPYFLFTGVLVRRIENWVHQMQGEFPDLPIHLGHYFGEHPGLMEITFQREQEALEGRAHMNCDHCRFRLMAAGDGHHHSHHHGASAHGPGCCKEG